MTIVTTGSFSRQAEAMASDLGVIFIDGEALLDLLDDLEAWEAARGHGT